MREEQRLGEFELGGFCQMERGASESMLSQVVFDQPALIQYIPVLAAQIPDYST